jgi:hypothetical protein
MRERERERERREKRGRKTREIFSLRAKTLSPILSFHS